jgi:hypothetical protein
MTKNLRWGLDWRSMLERSRALHAMVCIHAGVQRVLLWTKGVPGLYLCPLSACLVVCCWHRGSPAW